MFPLWLSVALACCLSLTASAQDKLDSSALEWKLDEGQQFLVTTSYTSDINTVAETRKTTYRNQTTAEYAWQVIAVDSSGNATVEQTLNRIKLDFRDPARPDQAIVVDTNADREPPDRASKARLEKIVPMIGVKLRFTLSSRGVISNLTWPDEIDKKHRLMFGLAATNSDQSAAQPFQLNPIPAEPATRWEVTSQVGREENSRRTHVFEIVPDQSTAAETVVKVSTSEDQLNLDPQELEIGQTAEVLEYRGQGMIRFNTAAGVMSESTMSRTVKTSMEYREKTITVETRTESKIDIRPAT